MAKKNGLSNHDIVFGDIAGGLSFPKSTRTA
jgi:hypothetical protein